MRPYTNLHPLLLRVFTPSNTFGHGYGICYLVWASMSTICEKANENGPCSVKQRVKAYTTIRILFNEITVSSLGLCPHLLLRS